ncbi:MAG: hypothetical protein QM790_12425 [Nibricoccus sp.]
MKVLLCLWHAVDGDNFRWWNLGGWGNTVSRCEMAVNGGREAYGPSVPFTVEVGRWYDLRLEVEGAKARGYVDGKLVMETNATEHKPSPTAFASASYLNGKRRLGCPLDVVVGTRVTGRDFA